MVVGIAANSKYGSIGEDRAAAMFSPYLQRSSVSRFAHIVVRATDPENVMNHAIATAIAHFDPSAAYTVQPLSAAIAFAFLPSRVGAVLIGALGGLGVLLAMIGLYGTVSYAVSRRTSEIGIRMALGASRGAVVRLVMTDGGMLVGAGLIVGLAVAAVATSPLRAFLVADLKTTDAISYFLTALVLGLTSLAACWSPARRATRVHPSTALRME
jgi:ABC-type antimicrobial peptide transport system permease subunit